MLPGRSRPRSSPRARAAILASLLVSTTLMILGPRSAGGATAPVAGPGPLPNLDVRAGSVAPTAPQLDLVRSLGASVRWNRFGTPQSLIRYGGFLGTGYGGDAVRAARDWIRDHRLVFRLSSAGVDRLEVFNDSPMVGSPGHAVIFRQRFGGLPAGTDGLITVGVTEGKIAYVSSSAAGDGGAPPAPSLSPAEAWRRAAANVGLPAPAGAISRIRREFSWTVFDVAGFSLPQRARLVAVPTPTEGVKAAFEVNVVRVGGGEALAYTSFVDARTGRVLVRHSRVDHHVPAAPAGGSNPRWKFFAAYPTPDYSGVDNRVVGCWEPAAGCDVVLAGPATRGAWDYNFRTNLPTNTTMGNAAVTAESWFSPLTPGLTGYRPVSLAREYVYGWQDQWNDERCSTLVFTSLNRNDIDAAVTHLFAGHNRMHDWSYLLGFTERNSNLQDVNFGETSIAREHDPEIGDVQAGAVVGGFPTYLGRDNANQITLQDGIPGITNQYLFQPIAAAFYSPCADGDFDMSVVGHEYTHAISNRMVGGPDAGILSDQGGAMGESWSDLVAQEHLLEYSLIPVADENPWAIGVYATGSKSRGIRNYAINDNPLNYSDVGYDIVGEQVHADGEIWSAVNFDIRRALNAKYDAQFPSSDPTLQASCANGLTPVTECPGNRRWVQILFDAFLLEPPSLSMLDARDAYLAADMMRFGGANQAELWGAFARRGFGQFADSWPDDHQPEANFESPLAGEATVRFRVVARDEAGNPPVAANVFVGRYQARVTPIADTDPGTADVADTARFVPGTYEFLVQADGYGMFRFTRTLRAGQNVQLTIAMATNWASRHQGATAAASGGSPAGLIDDSEHTNWTAKKLLPLPGVDGYQVTVNLAGGRHVVRTVNVSAYLTRDENRFTALRRFEIWTCSGPLLDPTCLLPTSFRKIYASPGDAFPASAPRPLAPDLILRTFDVPDTAAVKVRLVVKTNQCTGGPDYQGEQDDDLLNITDCTLGALDVASEVSAAELQVFSSPSVVSSSST